VILTAHQKQTGDAPTIARRPPGNHLDPGVPLPGATPFDAARSSHAEVLRFPLDRRPDADGEAGQTPPDRYAGIAVNGRAGSLTPAPEKLNKRRIVFHVKEWPDISGSAQPQWAPSGHFIQVQLTSPPLCKAFRYAGAGAEGTSAKFNSTCCDLTQPGRPTGQQQNSSCAPANLRS